MKQEMKRFLWGVLGIVILFFTIQNFQAVKTGLGMIVDLVLPLIYGCVVAFILNLVVVPLERVLTFGPFRNKTFRRVVSVLLSVILIVAVISGVIAGLVPQVKESGALLMEKLPHALDQTVDFLVNRLHLPVEWFSGLMNLDISQMVETLFQNGIIQQLLASGGNIVGDAVTVVLDVLIGLCFSFYILMQKEKLGEGIRRIAKAYLKPETNQKLLHVFSNMSEIYRSFISGQCLDALILGTMVSVVLAIFGIHYPLLIGIVVALTTLVPVVGSFLGGAVAFILLLMVSPREALIFLVVLLILQQVDNRLIYPHIVGNAVGLPAIWIFVAIIVGGNLGGIFGMLLAIPLFALIYTLLGQDLRKREQIVQEEEEKGEENL